MSVIVYDLKTIAADRQITWAGLCYQGSKIKRLADGTVLAWNGDQDSGLMMVRWYEDGAMRTEWPASQNKDDWSGLVVFLPTGELREYLRYPEPVVSIPTSPRAWGAGRDFALGALAMGADARSAVEVATQFSESCGFGVEAFDLKPQFFNVFKTGGTQGAD